MPSIKKSRLIKIRTSFGQCRFPSLSEHAIKLRKKYREDTEFREKMQMHSQNTAKTKKYSPEKYRKMQMIGRQMALDPELLKTRKVGRKPNVEIEDKRLWTKEEYNRPNDYAGVLTMSDYQTL